MGPLAIEVDPFYVKPRYRLSRRSFPKRLLYPDCSYTRFFILMQDKPGTARAVPALNSFSMVHEGQMFYGLMRTSPLTSFVSPDSLSSPSQAVQTSHLLVRPHLHDNVDPWMPDQVGYDGLEVDRAWRSRKPALTR